MAYYSAFNSPLPHPILEIVLKIPYETAEYEMLCLWNVQTTHYHKGPTNIKTYSQYTQIFVQNR